MEHCNVHSQPNPPTNFNFLQHIKIGNSLGHEKNYSEDHQNYVKHNMKAKIVLHRGCNEDIDLPRMLHKNKKNLSFLEIAIV
jgi:hypothetical protein